jgi:hypothetical protein
MIAGAAVFRTIQSKSCEPRRRIAVSFGSIGSEERLFMSEIYVMQRANGDVFSLDDQGRFRVPLFNSSSDAILARLRNFGMLVFKPVQLDADLLKQLVPVGGAAEVEFWLVNDPSINLNRGQLVPPEQLALRMGNRVKLKTVPGNATSDESSSLSMPARSNPNATAAWEDEAGLYSKCA